MDNSFASVHPELVCERSDKNAPLTPAQITYGSKKMYVRRDPDTLLLLAESLLHIIGTTPVSVKKANNDDIDQKYYDGWDQALAKIYDLLLQKLSEEDRQALNDDQQRWLDQREKLATTATMSFVGDMTKMRAYELISAYFGDRFHLS